MQSATVFEGKLNDLMEIFIYIPRYIKTKLINAYSNDCIINPSSVAIPYHMKSVALSLTDTQFLIAITFIPLKLGGSPIALTFLGI